MVVLTGSMEPAFKRGDILFLHLGTAPVRTGEIVVYNVTKVVPPGYTGSRDDIPIVHRVMTVHERADSNHLDLLTKVSTTLGPTPTISSCCSTGDLLFLGPGTAPVVLDKGGLCSMFIPLQQLQQVGQL